MMTLEERTRDRLSYEKRIAIDALAWLRRGLPGRAVDLLAREISMAEVEGEWIAMATRRVISCGHLRRLVDETSRCLWCDMESGEVDDRDILGVDLDHPRARHLCDIEAVHLIRQALDQWWTSTHWGERYTETPRGRRMARGLRSLRRRELA